jgi:thiamine-phosphate pyrophosphorylase
MVKSNLKTPNHFRLIDANLNRCREGLRVIEDTARFILEEEKIYKNIRSLRHELQGLTKGIYPELLLNRDSINDSGRAIKEGKRKSIKEVLIANFKRAQEALRVLEEYGRLISPSAGAGFKKIRYDVYNIEKVMLKDIK